MPMGKRRSEEKEGACLVDLSGRCLYWDERQMSQTRMSGSLSEDPTHRHPLAPLAPDVPAATHQPNVVENVGPALILALAGALFVLAPQLFFDGRSRLRDSFRQRC